MGVSFKTFLRCRGDVMMGRRCYVLLRRRYDVPIRRLGDPPLRRLGDIPSRRRWVFHLRCTCDVTGTYRETSLRRRHDLLMPGGRWAGSNISKRCLLYLHEKLLILNYHNPAELLNKRSKLMRKCRHENNFLLGNFKGND